MGFGKFEGEEVLLAQLTVGAFRIPTATPLHKGDEVFLVVRVHVNEIAFPPGETPARVQKGKVLRRKVGQVQTTTVAALVTDPEQRTELAQWLEDEVDARDGVARLADDGPDWLAPTPAEAKPKRARKKGTAATAAQEAEERWGGTGTPMNPVEGDTVAGDGSGEALEPFGDQYDDGDRIPEVAFNEDDAARWESDARRVADGGLPMTDEEWEASGGRLTEP